MDITPGLPSPLRQVADCVYELAPDFRPGMQVPVRLIADERLLREWSTVGFDRLVAFSMLPKVHGPVVALPNLNQTDDFPSGAVVGTEYPEGVLVPAGVGPEINCGLRLHTSALTENDLASQLPKLLDELEQAIPTGTERGAPFHISEQEFDDLLKEGCRYLVRQKGVGVDEDLDRIEHNGHYHDANAEHLSKPARNLGMTQLGTLGRGRSHFLEVGIVDEVYDQETAHQLDLMHNQVTVLLHAGARALGERTYQEAERKLGEAMKRERQPEPPVGVACASLDTSDGLWWYHAIRAAANYAWANRHVLTHQARRAFERVFGGPGTEVLKVGYDGATNVVNLERAGDDDTIVCVHRRSAVSAYGPGNRMHVPRAYRDLGQPVIVPGSEGRDSYVMLADLAEDLSLASAPHGSGRTVSRSFSRRHYPPHAVRARREQDGVLIRAPDMPELRAEAPEAYRDAGEIASVLERAGVARRIARLRPRGLVKG